MKQLKIRTFIILLTVCISSSLAAQNKSENPELNPFAFRFHVSPSYTLLSNNLKSDINNADANGGLGFSTSADFVYYFLSKDNFRINLSIGLGYSTHRDGKNISYEKIYTATDIDNDEVNVTETVSNLKEKQMLNTFDIPVRLGLDLKLSERLEGILTLGTSYGLKSKSKYTTSAMVTRTGFYPDYNALVFDVDVEGAPYFYPSNKDMKTEDELKVKNNISLLGSVGLKYKFNEQVSALIAVSYAHGLTDVLDVEDSPTIIKHNDGYIYSLNSLASRGDKVKSRSLGLEFGIQYNFWKLLK